MTFSTEQRADCEYENACHEHERGHRQREHEENIEGSGHGQTSLVAAIYARVVPMRPEKTRIRERKLNTHFAVA
jgi:hypothetical protein